MGRVDFAIVGQGLAGTALARQLLRRGARVLVIDRGGESSSRVAAGLVTPVTGKRLARSWRWDELYPAAVAYYRDFERDVGAPVFHQRPAVRLFAGAEERAEFERRAGMLAGLVRTPDHVPVAFAAPFGGFEMPHAARLDAPRYLDLAREHFRRAGAYRAADLDLAREVELVPGGVRLPRLGVEARGLVFCRGFAPGVDPWFGGVKFNAAKGEILTLRVPGLAEDRVVHRGIWLAPAGGGVFRAGATYTWEPLDSLPTPEGRAEIESRLAEFLRLPFEVIDHRAAVRPVIEAGFPVLGRHPDVPQLAYFNGLGSKGSLLAPFFADQLAACLVGDGEVESEVDVARVLTR
jgi:glycine/D-amino acid oxidase-like deaminating enzyme